LKINRIAAVTFVSALGLSVLASAPVLAAAGGPSGEWAVGDGSAIVRISKCGGGFCGFVARGEPGRDYRNPNPAKRNRSVIGIQVLFNLRGGPTTWSGQTYNAEDGQMYDASITLMGPSTLKIEGCVPGGGACGSQTWTRAR
jgi:uncharacterized protein (DUF2147 family)